MSNHSNGGEPRCNTANPTHDLPREELRPKFQETEATVEKAVEKLQKSAEQGLQVPVGRIQCFDGSWSLYSSQYLECFSRSSESEPKRSANINSDISSEKSELGSYQLEKCAATGQQGSDPSKDGEITNKLQSNDPSSNDQQTKAEKLQSSKPVAPMSLTTEMNKFGSVALRTAAAMEEVALLTGNNEAIAKAKKTMAETEQAVAVADRALDEAMTMEEQALSIRERALILGKPAPELVMTSVALTNQILALEKQILAVQMQALAIEKRVGAMMEAATTMYKQAKSKKMYALAKLKHCLPAELQVNDQVVTETKDQNASSEDEIALAKTTNNNSGSEDKVAQEQHISVNNVDVETVDNELDSGDCPTETGWEIIFAMDKVLVRCIGQNCTTLTFDFDIPQYASLDPITLTDDKTGVKMDLTMLGDGILKLALDPTQLRNDKPGQTESSGTKKITLYGVFKKRE